MKRVKFAVWSFLLLLQAVLLPGAKANYANGVMDRIDDRAPDLMQTFYLQRNLIDMLVNDLRAVEGGYGLRAPRVNFIIGPYGSGKTTALEEVLKTMLVPLDRVHYLEPDLGKVSINFEPVFTSPLPGDGSNLTGIIVVDEFLNLTSWSELVGIPGLDESQGPSAEMARKFWSTPKGERLKMWIDMHDILGSGKLKIDRDFLNRRGINYDIVEDLNKMIREQSQIMAKRPGALEKSSDENKRLASRLEDEVAAAQRDFDNHTATVLNVFKSRANDLDDKIDDEENEEKLIRLRRQLKDAEDKVTKANAENSQLSSKLEEKKNQFRKVTKLIEEGQEILRNIEEDSAGLKPKIRRGLDLLRNYYPSYLHALFDSSNLSIPQMTDLIFNSPDMYLGAMASVGLKMPQSLQINRQNFLFYFIGNPKGLLEEVERRFKESDAKDPDALRQIVAEVQGLNQRVQQDLMDKLGLNPEIIQADPQIPSALKGNIVELIRQIQSRLQISGVKFQLPPRTSDYQSQLRIWLDDTYDIVRSSKAEFSDVEFTMNEASFDVVFDTVVDALGAIRRSSANFMSLRGKMVGMSRAGLNELLRAGHHVGRAASKRQKTIAAVNWEFTQINNLEVSIRAHFLDSQGKVVHTVESEIEKPSKSWEEQTSFSSRPSDEQVALHQAAHLVLGMHYFGSVAEISLDFASEDIGRTLWASQHFDSNLVIGQIATLLGGMVAEDIANGDSFLPETRLAQQDDRITTQLVSQLISEMTSASQRRGSTLRALGGGVLSPREILANRLSIDLLRLRASEEPAVLIKGAIMREVKGLLHRNQGLLMELAKHLRDYKSINKQEIMSYLENPPAEYAALRDRYTSLTQSDIARIGAANPGSISTHGSILCLDILQKGGSIPNSGPSSENRPNTSLRQEVKDIGTEVRGLWGDIMSIFD